MLPANARTASLTRLGGRRTSGDGTMAQTGALGLVLAGFPALSTQWHRQWLRPGEPLPSGARLLRVVERHCRPNAFHPLVEDRFDVGSRR